MEYTMNNILISYFIFTLFLYLHDIIANKKKSQEKRQKVDLKNDIKIFSKKLDDLLFVI